MVPRSFSRTTERAVDSTAVSIMMKPMSPGTRKRVDFSSGLYQTRGSYPIGTASIVPPAASRASAAFAAATRPDGVAEHRGGRVGVAPVEEQLDLRGAPRGELGARSAPGSPAPPSRSAAA